MKSRLALALVFVFVVIFSYNESHAQDTALCSTSSTELYIREVVQIQSNRQEVYTRMWLDENGNPTGPRMNTIQVEVFDGGTERVLMTFSVDMNDCGEDGLPRGLSGDGRWICEYEWFDHEYSRVYSNQLDNYVFEKEWSYDQDGYRHLWRVN